MYMSKIITLTEDTYEITNSTFEIQLEPGEHKDRFSLVFQSKLVDSSTLTSIDETVKIYVNNEQSILNIEKYAEIDVLEVTLFNYLGQSIHYWGTELDSRNIQLPVNTSTGVYIVNIKTSLGFISKKVLIE